MTSKRTSITLTDDDQAAIKILRALSEDSDIPQSIIIRTALRTTADCLLNEMVDELLKAMRKEGKTTDHSTVKRLVRDNIEKTGSWGGGGA